MTTDLRRRGRNDFLNGVNHIWNGIEKKLLWSKNMWTQKHRLKVWIDLQSMLRSPRSETIRLELFDAIFVSKIQLWIQCLHCFRAADLFFDESQYSGKFCFISLGLLVIDHENFCTSTKSQSSSNRSASSATKYSIIGRDVACCVSSFDWNRYYNFWAFSIFI